MIEELKKKIPKYESSVIRIGDFSLICGSGDFHSEGRCRFGNQGFFSPSCIRPFTQPNANKSVHPTAISRLFEFGLPSRRRMT